MGISLSFLNQLTPFNHLKKEQDNPSSDVDLDQEMLDCVMSGEVHIMMLPCEDTSGEVRMFRAHT